jgi:hypothetical protein
LLSDVPSTVVSPKSTAPEAPAAVGAVGAVELLEVLEAAVEPVEASVANAGVGDSEFIESDAKLDRGAPFTWCDRFLLA